LEIPVGVAAPPLSPALFAALADDTRLEILSRLRTHDLCVCHLVEQLGLKQSIVSHHVGILRRAGLVSTYPNASDRRWLYYRLQRDALQQLHAQLGWLAEDTGVEPVPLPCGPDADDAAADAATPNSGEQQ
jgi:ArsR family transcriptional regulator